MGAASMMSSAAIVAAATARIDGYELAENSFRPRDHQDHEYKGRSNGQPPLSFNDL